MMLEGAELVVYETWKCGDSEGGCGWGSWGGVVCRFVGFVGFVRGVGGMMCVMSVRGMGCVRSVRGRICLRGVRSVRGIHDV